MIFAASNAEPPFPNHATVVCSLRAPDFVVHLPSKRCSIQEPHTFGACGEFDPPEERYWCCHCDRESNDAPTGGETEWDWIDGELVAVAFWTYCRACDFWTEHTLVAA